MLYKGKFYTERAIRTRYSASRVLNLVIDKLFDKTPEAVLDVGCGTGVWLSELERIGVKQTIGLEGSWLPKDSFLADGVLHNLDFNTQLKNFHNKPVDLCISLEVAEHLPKQFAHDFVGNLTRFSDTILFSAAVNGQGGRHHINEQPLSYWANLFDKFGYSVVDAIRPEIWNDPQIPFWYRQNIVIFTKNQHILKKYSLSVNAILLDAIHPELFENYRYPRLYIATSQILQFPKAIYRTIKKRMNL